MVFLQARFLCSIAAAIALSFVLGGGSSDRGDINNRERLRGEVRVDGSATVFPISEPMAGEFMKENPEVKVIVQVSGSGGGFKKFCAGQTDITNSSRPIKVSEIELCREVGIEFVEIPIAFEGLVVAVNNENNWIDCMTPEELGKMWESAAEGQVDRWNQIRDDFPNETLSLYGYGIDSSSYDYFTYVTHGEEGESRGDYTASYDDDFLTRNIQADRGGLGFFGFPYYEEHQDLVKAIAIKNNRGECVLPSRESIQNRSYNPLSRRLFIYVKRESLETNPAVKAFVEYHIDAANTWIVDKSGYYMTLPSEFLSNISEWVSQIEITETNNISEISRLIRDWFRERIFTDRRRSQDKIYARRNILIDGSSVVFPISEVMGEEFAKENPETIILVGISGSGGGFKKFCQGETDITNSTRPIRASEIELCREVGIEFVEIPIAFQAISVVINNDNDWVNCMDPNDLARAWEPSAEGRIDRWNQIRDNFPNESLVLWGTSTASPTYDYFTDATHGDYGESRGDFTASEDNNVIALGVQSDRGSLGFFRFSDYKEHRNSVKVVKIENHDGECIAPSRKSIENGSYTPLSRPLFIYVKKESLENKPAVKAFAKFQIDRANAPLIREVGYVPLPRRLVSKLKRRLDRETIGSVFEGGSSLGIDLSDRF